MFAAIGVPQALLRPIGSAVDKLDKFPWSETKKEMEEKGLESSIATELGEYLLRETVADITSKLALLTSDTFLSTNTDVRQGVEEMELLMRYLSAYDVAKYVQLQLSLARGQDYYTGLIYEVVPQYQASTSIGSIPAGGRYNNLVGMFSGRDVPCVGI
ncbi:Cytoplasmic and mitochondrial histidine tRNA synthetase [Exserohilum turcicum]